MASRAVLKPPGSAARGIIEWAIDLWPYVNGKALTYGLRLKEMVVTDMVDVLHYFLEEDLRYHTAEEADAVEKVRTQIYGSMYQTNYKYRTNRQSSRSSYGGSDSFDGFSSSSERKPYIPPTEFNPNSSMPYGSLLDAPLQ